jgi:ABC-type bacteriocin/lantibiotic exporter with double-glycine peptidase domain
MITTEAITSLHRAFIRHYHVKEDPQVMMELEKGYSHHETISPTQFLDTLVDTGASHHLIYLWYVVSEEDLVEAVHDFSFPFVVFQKPDETEKWMPVFVNKHKNGQVYAYTGKNERKAIPSTKEWVASIAEKHHIIRETDDKNGKLVVTAFPKEITYSDPEPSIDHDKETPRNNPFDRFFKFLENEKQAITYIYAYSVFTSLFSLTLPLGVQAIIGFVSNQQMNTSIAVLIFLIVLGTLVHGALQFMQVRLVEHIQQRIFARTAFEFAYRVPRFKLDTLKGQYAPELVNRFFEVVSLQKGVSNILVEFTVALVQIVLGLLLLSFYHISFIVFGIVLLAILFVILRLTAQKGLKTSMLESKYKYSLAYWLQEVARAMSTFKLAGYSNLPMQKTDHYLMNYLHSRQDHFKVLTVQYLAFILFKTVVTGGLLVLGCVLTINEQINLGQFIASEIVIIMIMNAIEKIILKVDVVYDVLTGIQKIGAVLDMPIESPRGVNLENVVSNEGLHVEVKDLKFRYNPEDEYVLNSMDLDLQAGERVCLSGFSGSGKTTLANIIIGYFGGYEGVLNINGIPLRNINKNSLISFVGDNVSQEDVFHGTILENVTLGKTNISITSVLWALDIAGLRDSVNRLPEGINTELLGAGTGFHEDFTQKIILARAVCKRPKLLVLDIESLNFDKKQMNKVLEKIVDPKRDWTVLFLSNDPSVMAKCEKVVVMEGGLCTHAGSFESLKKEGAFQEII